MKLTSQEEYGLRCLLRIAREGEGGSLTIPKISEKEGISNFYVAKLMRILRRGGLVKSVRGQAGGYAMARAGGPDHGGRGAGGAGRPALRSGVFAKSMPAASPCARIQWIARCARCGAPCSR